jgi:hypothetical protein
LKPATICSAVVFRNVERLEHSLQDGEQWLKQESEIMESVVNSDVRELCKAVLEEEDSERLKVLLDELLRVLDERQLAAALL